MQNRRWILLWALVPLIGCAPREPLDVTHPDPSVKIPAMKHAVRQHDITALRQLISDLSNDDPAVRFYAISALQRLTGQEYAYHFYDEESQREAAVLRWKQWLKEQESRN
jgi:hypothetical protein